MRKPRGGSYTRAAAKVRAEAEICWICGGPFDDPADPPVADHVQPRRFGGSDRIETSRPRTKTATGDAVRSSPCVMGPRRNSRRGSRTRVADNS